VAVHDLEAREPELFQNARGDIDAAVAVLADAGLVARAGQQHADLERCALRTADAERCGAGKQAGSRAGREGPAGHAGIAGSRNGPGIRSHYTPPWPFAEGTSSASFLADGRYP